MAASRMAWRGTTILRGAGRSAVPETCARLSGAWPRALKAEAQPSPPATSRGSGWPRADLRATIAGEAAGRQHNAEQVKGATSNPSLRLCTPTSAEVRRSSSTLCSHPPNDPADANRKLPELVATPPKSTCLRRRNLSPDKSTSIHPLAQVCRRKNGGGLTHAKGITSKSLGMARRDARMAHRNFDVQKRCTGRLRQGAWKKHLPGPHRNLANRTPRC